MTSRARVQGPISGFKCHKDFLPDITAQRILELTRRTGGNTEAVQLPDIGRSTGYKIHAKVCTSIENKPSSVTSRRIEAIGDMLNFVSQAAIGMCGLNVTDEHPNGDVQPDFIWGIDATGNGIGRDSDVKGRVRVTAGTKEVMKELSRSICRFKSPDIEDKIGKYRCMKSIFNISASGRMPLSLHIIKVISLLPIIVSIVHSLIMYYCLDVGYFVSRGTLSQVYLWRETVLCDHYSLQTEKRRRGAHVCSSYRADCSRN